MLSYPRNEQRRMKRVAISGNLFPRRWLPSHEGTECEVATSGSDIRSFQRVATLARVYVRKALLSSILEPCRLKNRVRGSCQRNALHSHVVSALDILIRDSDIDNRLCVSNGLIWLFSRFLCVAPAGIIPGRCRLLWRIPFLLDSRCPVKA